MAKGGRLLAPVAIVALLSLACSLGLDPGLSPASPAVQTGGATSPVRPASTPARAGSFYIGPSLDLSRLQSYRTTVTLAFTGTRNGQPAAGRLETLTELTRQPPALHQSLLADTALPRLQIVSGMSEFFRVNDRIYVKKGDEDAWAVLADGPLTAGDMGFFEPNRLIILPQAASQPPTLSTLGGLTVQRYTFTENDLGDPNFAFDRARGEVWVDLAGRYVVQYALSATLRVAIPDPKIHIFDEGQLNLRYTVTDINTDFTISYPDQAAMGHSLASTLPLLPDAEIVSILPAMIEYTSAITPVSAVLFYQDELSLLNWEEKTIMAFNEKAHLSFAREDQTATVIINPAGKPGKFRVLLSVENAP